MMDDIKTIVEMAQRGNQKSFQRLYECTFQRNYYLVLKITKNEQDAQDILQEAYIKIYTKLDQYNYTGPASFASWTARVVINTALNYIRKEKPIVFSEIESENDCVFDIEDKDECTQPEKAYDQKEISEIVNEVLNSLPFNQRLCILLYYFQEMSVKEIAIELDCSENTVKSRLNYGRNGIRKNANVLIKKGILSSTTLSLSLFISLLRDDSAMAMFKNEKRMIYNKVVKNESINVNKGMLRSWIKGRDKSKLIKHVIEVVIATTGGIVIGSIVMGHIVSDKNKINQAITPKVTNLSTILDLKHKKNSYKTPKKTYKADRKTKVLKKKKEDSHRPAPKPTTKRAVTSAKKRIMKNREKKEIVNK